MQLAWALRSRIRDGLFQPGQRLPGLREVAEATGVNVNTVRTVYQRLEQEGLIDSQQGSGTFVAPAPQQRATVTAIAADAAREAHATGVDPREVAAALYVSPAAASPDAAMRVAAPTSADGAAERRRALREQIACSSARSARSKPNTPASRPAEVARARGIGPALLDAAALEQVRTMLVRRLAACRPRSTGDRQRRGRAQRARPTRKRAPRAQQPRRAATKPASRRAPRARGPMRPAPEGA